MLFMQNGGYVIELVAPRSERSVVWRLNKKLGNTPYHICYESDDWESDVKALLDNGFMQITEKSHAPAIGNAQVAFYMSRDIGMVELLDKVE
jgi:methylmalonyl-CoA/ethylmalonyl-CoA epimerase